MFSRIAGFLALMVCFALPTWAAAPVVSNVSASQRSDGSKKVDIWYNVSDSDSPTLVISVSVSSNGGSSYTISPTSFGPGSDVGSNVARGTGKHIIWNAGTTLPGAYGTSYKVAVTASDSAYAGQMIYIPAGSFLMGNSNVGADATYRSSCPNELPQHSVSLSAYYIGKYEVTRGEYRAFMNAGGYTNSSYWSSAGWSWKVSNSRTEPSYWAAAQDWYGGQPFTQTDNHPVVGVSYYEAEAFCNWAGGHLPTEAQWERAARWNTTTSHPNVYPWGDTWNQEYCNNYYDSNPAGGGYQRCQTAPVGSYSAYGSPSGCQDMAGNVWEWCKDWYGSTYYSTSPSSDPPGQSSGSYRVLRGGSWGNDAYYYYRCGYRYFNYSGPSGSDYYSGFRLAR